MKRRKVGVWPTREQELLLRACLLQGPKVIAAWESWKALASLDHLDLGSYRLLPLLYSNLKRHNVEDSLMGRLKGIYRLTWYQNQLLFHLLTNLLRSFHEASIKTMLLKGVALVELYYRERGLRWIGDLDVLVHPDQAPLAIEILERSAWKPITPSGRGEIRQSAFIFKHAQSFQNVDGQEFDLHWHVLYHFLPETPDKDFWEGAQSMVVEGNHTSALNPTDQLLHVCIHGAEWLPFPSVRWAADALTILYVAGSAIDWQRLEDLAVKHKMHLPMLNMLSYLQEHLEAPIPLAVLESLRSRPITRKEQQEYRVITHSHALWGMLPMLWYRYWMLSPERQPIRGLIGFLSFLKDIWGVDHVWQMPFHAILRGAKRIRMLLHGKGSQSLASSPTRNLPEEHL